MLDELRAALFLFLLIVIGSAAGCFVAMEVRAYLKQRRQHKQQVAEMIAGKRRPVPVHPFVGTSPAFCLQPLIHGTCRTHGRAPE